jgi:hypothetical protein
MPQKNMDMQPVASFSPCHLLLYPRVCITSWLSLLARDIHLAQHLLPGLVKTPATSIICLSRQHSPSSSAPCSLSCAADGGQLQPPFSS